MRKGYTNIHTLQNAVHVPLWYIFVYVICTEEMILLELCNKPKVFNETHYNNVFPVSVMFHGTENQNLFYMT